LPSYSLPALAVLGASLVSALCWQKKKKKKKKTGWAKNMYLKSWF
jgi:hypothetical protein